MKCKPGRSRKATNIAERAIRPDRRSPILGISRGGDGWSDMGGEYGSIFSSSVDTSFLNDIYLRALKLARAGRTDKWIVFSFVLLMLWLDFLYENPFTINLLLHFYSVHLW